jgi:hypothetical protein
MNRFVLLVLGIVAVGCSSQNPVGPGSPAANANAIEAAHVLVAGVPVEGTVMMGEHGTTRFEVRMRDRDAGSLSNVRQVMLRYDVPAAGMMHGRTGDTLCYDDGTHGDDVAGDGIYHRLDEDGSMGCGHAGAPAGTYSYTFQCAMVSGDSCGEMMLSVTRR